MSEGGAMKHFTYDEYRDWWTHEPGIYVMPRPIVFREVPAHREPMRDPVAEAVKARMERVKAEPGRPL